MKNASFPHVLKYLRAPAMLRGAEVPLLSLSGEGLQCSRRSGHSAEYQPEQQPAKHQSSPQGTFTKYSFSISKSSSSRSTNRKGTHTAAGKNMHSKDSTTPESWILLVPLSLCHAGNTIEIVFRNCGSTT